MTSKLILKFQENNEKLVPTFYFQENYQNLLSVLQISNPISLKIWNKDKRQYDSAYSSIEENNTGFTGKGLLTTPEGTKYSVTDEWLKISDDTWQVHRQVKVEAGNPNEGFQIQLDVNTNFDKNVRFEDLRYFAPPALFDKNDLDEDGIEDYLSTQNLMYREDRLNMLAVMAYHEEHKLSMSLIRADVPAFDSTPNRPNKERTFLQKTDIGSLGVWKTTNENQMSLRACYPFYEGERTHALYMQERIDWEAYWPSNEGEIIEVSYQIRVEKSPSFIDAMWSTYSRRVIDLNPEPVELPASAGKLTEYRVEALDRYFVELDKTEDENEPAGYVLNCHPQNGEQLSNIIQFGFTGQNILSAYNVLRYGYQNGDSEFVRKARKVVDFFVNKVHIQETGMFYNLYSIEKKSFDFWWTGLLLPLAYAEGEELQKLMGPLYNHREFVIKHLREKKGSYLRCMNEDAHALLLVYEFEKGLGNDHQEWLEAAKRYGEFLLRTQEADGTWYRAYDLSEKPILEPAFWFGTTKYEQKSSTASSVPFLTKLYELTKDERYLEAGKKAGKFVREVIVSGVKFNGGIHDSIYAKGQLIDHESILFPMLALYDLYKVTEDEYFLKGAHDAARIAASWTCLWDVPLPEESTLATFGFRSTGIGACDTAGAGYTHPFELAAVPETTEIALKTGDKELLKVAELLWHGCNQTVAVPGKDWGYRYIGLQEEGYLISWWAADDPMFGDTGFGKRWKGEGNKTCFPWINAVALSCYWKLIDNYGTTDFKFIK